MTESRVHDEIEIERVAESLYNDVWSRSESPWCVSWAEASPELHAEYRAKAQRILDGVLILPVEGVMPRPLSQIEVEEIPHAISVLMARWTQVVGSIPELPRWTQTGQQGAETVDYVGPLQEVDIVLADEGDTETFVEIETPNGHSVSVGRRHDKGDGLSRIRIRVPFADLPEATRQRVRQHG